MTDSSVDDLAVDEQQADEQSDQQEDGRTARRERNRVSMVDAMLELFREGNLAPSSDQIAERSGLSPRSLFRYFEDLEDLVQVAIARQQQRIAPFLVVEVSVGASFGERVESFVTQRLRLLDAMGAVAQVARLRAPFQPSVRTQLGQIRAHLRRQIETLFAPELGQLGSDGATTALAALDVVFSFEAHRLMRDDQQLSPAQCASVLSDALVRLLSQET